MVQHRIHFWSHIFFYLGNLRLEMKWPTMYILMFSALLTGQACQGCVIDVIRLEPVKIPTQKPVEAINVNGS